MSKSEEIRILENLKTSLSGTYRSFAEKQRDENIVKSMGPTAEKVAADELLLAIDTLANLNLARLSETGYRDAVKESRGLLAGTFAGKPIEDSNVPAFIRSNHTLQDFYEKASSDSAMTQGLLVLDKLITAAENQDVAPAVPFTNKFVRGSREIPVVAQQR